MIAILQNHLSNIDGLFTQMLIISLLLFSFSCEQEAAPESHKGCQIPEYSDKGC